MTRDEVIDGMRKAIVWHDCNFVGGTDDAICQFPLCCDCRQMAIEALSALEAMGLAIVPVTPSVVMVNAGHEAADESEGGFTECTGAVTAKNVYRAMLSASPLRKADPE
jgi:hypothetical protein